MLKTENFKIIVAFALLLITANCDKDSKSPYVGDFIFTSYSYYSALGYTPVYQDTITYQGSIDIFDRKKNIIIINYRPTNSDGYTCNNVKIYGSSIKTSVGSDGILEITDIPISCQIFFSGRFQNPDNLNFEIGQSSALGTWRQIVNGNRK